MRKLYILIMLVVAPVLIMAQTAGGQVVRPNRPMAKPTKPKPTPKLKTNRNIDTMQTANLSVVLKNLVDNMVYVEGGTFMMGATSEQGSDAYSSEKPAHQVTLYSFYIGKYEVTQEEWETVMGSNPSNFKGAKLPVENVSWYDSQEFISKLNELTGLKFRLPTEAEWEYAARGGNRSMGYEFAGSNGLNIVGWCDGISDDKTHEVGKKQPNELGLFDMSGNVFEWCYDWKGTYNSSLQTNPQGPSNGMHRVCRGGSWCYGVESCRVSDRNDRAPDERSDMIGLRLAL